MQYSDFDSSLKFLPSSFILRSLIPAVHTSLHPLKPVMEKLMESWNVNGAVSLVSSKKAYNFGNGVDEWGMQMDEQLVFFAHIQDYLSGSAVRRLAERRTCARRVFWRHRG